MTNLNLSKTSPIHKTQKLGDLGGDDLPRTCKRVVIRGTGGPDIMELIEGTMPEPAEGEARVRTLVAGVSFRDISYRRGVNGPKTPYTPGFDLLGVVDKLGEGVSGLEVGQIVAALMPELGTGGYTDYSCLEAGSLVRMPKGLDPAEAVCLVLNYTVAHQLLHRMAKVQPGEKVLIHGAAGGVGTALVELAVLAGCVCYGTASGGKHETVLERGATPIDYRSEDVAQRLKTLEPEGVDVVFDPVGSDHWDLSLQCLRPRGRLVVYGDMNQVKEGGSAWVRALRKLRMRFSAGGKRVLQYTLRRCPESTAETCRSDLEHLLGLLNEHKIRPLVARRVPLNKVSHAHRMLEEGEVSGKIVLLCNV